MPAYTSQRRIHLRGWPQPVVVMNSSRPGNASPVACQRDERGRRYPPSPPGPAGLPVDRRARPSPLQRRDAWTARSPVHAGRQAYLAACKCPRGSRQHPIPARQHDAIAGPGTRAPLVVTARRCTSKAGRRTIKARIFGRRSVGRDAPGGRRRRRDRAGRRRRSRSVTQVSSVVSALAANTRKLSLARVMGPGSCHEKGTTWRHE